MKKIAVKIVGDTPLLMHDPRRTMKASSGGKKEIPAPDVEAERAAYWSKDKRTLVLLSDHVHRCLINAARGFRIRSRESVIPYISGSIEVQPEEISLGTKKYEIDVRRVVVKATRSGVLRARPRLDQWSASFELHYDESVFTKEFVTDVLRDQIFLKAGKAVGLLEYRPEKGGRFGRFHVEKFEIL